MVLLKVVYNVSKKEFKKLRRALEVFLTPSVQAGIEGTLSELVDEGLEKFRKNLLPKKPIHYRINSAAVDYLLAQSIAQRLNRFHIEQDKDRYALPSKGDPDFKVDLFGTSINGMGDNPMQINTYSDFSGQTTQLSLLNSWSNFRKRHTREELTDEVIKVCTTSKGFSPEDSATMASLPREIKEFKKCIAKELHRLTWVSMVYSITLIRFFRDFIGEPLERNEYSPTGIEASVPNYGFRFLPNERDLKTITRCPTLPHDEVIRLILQPKREGFTPFKQYRNRKYQQRE